MMDDRRGRGVVISETLQSWDRLGAMNSHRPNGSIEVSPWRTPSPMPQAPGKPCPACGSPVTERFCSRHTPRVALVTGPPASGKTTYVRERHRPGELVVDVDSLFAAMTLDPEHAHREALLGPVLRARDAAVAEAAKLSALEMPALWIIACAPTEAERAEAVRPLRECGLVVLDVPADQCKARIASDGRESPGMWERRIDAWWRDYQRPEYGFGWRRATEDT